MKKILAFTLSLLMVLPLILVITIADSVTPDTSWYNANVSEFTLSDVADLLGFSQLAQEGNTFAGKTVKLGADITLNEGKAAFWKSQVPARSWTPVTDFAGTFDGQGHSISGVYCVGTSSLAFFAQLTGATVKNLSLKNSYVAGTGSNVAAFVATGKGSVTIENCYTDAIVSGGSNNVGGFVATLNSTVASELHLKNLWFDGSVTLKDRFGGGIVANGNTTDAGPCNIVVAESCLNSGTVYSSHTGTVSHIAGIVGRNDGKTYLTDCLNVGKVSSASSQSGANDILGSLVGKTGNAVMIDETTYKAHLSITNSWAAEESCPKAIGQNASPDPTQVIDYGVVDEDFLKGYGACYYTTLNFETAWAVDLYGFPTLQCFAKQILPLYDLNAPEMLDPEVKVEGCFGPRWTVTLDVPEGMSVADIEFGALIVPTKAIPAGHTVTMEDESFQYRNREYKVVKAVGDVLRDSDEGTLVATVVVTNLDPETARMNFTAVPYVTYRVKSGYPVTLYNDPKKITFYRETVLSLEGADEAYTTKVNTVLAPLDEQMGGRFPVSETWGEEDLFDEVPGLIAANSEIVASQDFGAGNYVISVKGTEVSDYEAYKATLEQFGFTKVYDNQADGQNGIEGVVFTSSFRRGDLLLTVTHMTNSNTEKKQTPPTYELDANGNQITNGFDPGKHTYNENYSDVTDISAIWDQPLSKYLYDNIDDEGTGAVSMHVSEMYNWGNSILFKLSNGHFVMNDGATDDDLPYLLDYMESLTGGEIPVVDAWFFSHLHWDHACVVRPFIDHPEWRERIRVNGFYFSEPSDAVKDLDKGVYNEIPDIKKAIGLLTTENGETPQIYRLQTGQRYFFSGMTAEVMLAQEQLPLSSYYRTYKEGYKDNPSKAYGYVDGFNGSSTWLRFNIGSQDVLIAGDSYFAGMEKMMACYDESMLDFDVFFAPHHGFNTWNAFTDYATLKTVIYCWNGIPSKDNYFDQDSNANEYIYEKYMEPTWFLGGARGERIHTGSGSLVLTFPYTFSASSWNPGYERLDPKDWIYHTETES